MIIKRKKINFWCTISIKKIYTVIQSFTSIYKIFNIVDGWVKHFCWCDNTWLNICIKKIYIDGASKLNLIKNNNDNMHVQHTHRPMWGWSKW